MTVDLPEITVTPTTPSTGTSGTGAQTGGSQAQATSSATPGPENVYVLPTRPANSPWTKEQAVLIVDGMNFPDWESVWVELEWMKDASFFRFVAVERNSPPGMFNVIQFGPGADVIILLGGVEVIHGKIETRQVAYDGSNHQVELIGKSYTRWPAISSVNTTTGNFDNMNFFQVANKVLSNFPVGIKVIGELNPLPFDKLQNQIGEKVWDFLERIARPRGILLGNDPFGNFLLIGQHGFQTIGKQLIEGANIKKCQYLLHHEYRYLEYKVVGQAAASDDNAGAAASQLEASWGGTGWLNSILITPAEQPVKSIAEVLDRAKNEAKWHEGDKMEAHITVQGWFYDDINLWWPGLNVYINSPMCPLDTTLKIKKATYRQDSHLGTETELEFKLPWDLNDYNPGDPGPGQSPDPTTDAPIAVPPGQGSAPVS